MARLLKGAFAAAACAGLFGVACAAPAESAKAPSAGAVAAQIGDQTITMDEVDELAKKNSADVYQKLYDARRQALDQKITAVLVEREAKAKGVTPAELLKTEVEDKIPAVSDADVKAFFDQNQARMQGQTLESMSDRIREYLGSTQTETVRTSYLASLKQKAGVKIALEPPRVPVEVAENDPAKGPANAPILLIEFSEFQCPYCARVGDTVKQVMDTYGDKVRLVFRDYPLPFHNNAHGAAEAGQCAHEQDKFWPYHDKLFQNQQALEPDKLKQYAADLGLDTAKFNECLDSGRFRARVDQDYQAGQAAGVSGTPAFFVNGRFLSGAQPFEAFAAIIDEELQLKAAR